MKIKNIKEKVVSDSQNLYTIVFFTLSILSSQFTYQGIRYLTRGLPHTDITTALDMRIPFLPWTVAIYFGTFAFWIVSYFFISRSGRPEADRFFCAQIITYAVTMLVFIFFPTTNVRPEITGGTVWDGMMRFLYGSDPPDGLFPSLHCIVSWLCWIGTRNNKKAPAAVKLLSLLAAAAICISTLTTKQHVIADAVGGILLSEAAYIIAGNDSINGIFMRFFDRLLKKDSVG